jgi:lysophospholipase L1-like esterase
MHFFFFQGTAMKKLVLIGDSIRMGYQATVFDILQGKAEIWAPQENGGTTRNVLDHLEEWVIQQKPDILHMNCGLHDLKREFGSKDYLVPLDEYEQNLRTIFSRSKELGNIKLIFALTTPVHEKWHHENKAFDRFEEDVDAFNRAASSAAEDHGAAVNDLFSVVSEAGKETILLQDGVHFSEQGYLLLGKAVADFILPYTE